MANKISRNSGLPVVGVFPPHVAADTGSNQNRHLPQPKWQEYNPVTPWDGVVQAQGKQEWEHQQTGEYQAFTEKQKWYWQKTS